MEFEILGQISRVETIASGRSVHNRIYLSRAYGKGNWRKRKGIARVRLASGEILLAELQWYEAHGIGRRDYKIKRYV